MRITRDPSPSFRRLSWSPDGSLLVLTSSNGSVDIYDSYGFHIYSVFSQNVPAAAADRNGSSAAISSGAPSSSAGAYAGAFFSDARIKSRDWLTELILVDYQVILLVPI